MKVFMVFLALMIVNLSFFVFTADFNNYSYLCNDLKILAEECACTAAQAVDEYSYALGEPRINEDLALEYAQHTLDSCTSVMPRLRNGTTDITELTANDGAVSVSLCYTSQADFFRLPFLQKYTAVRTAVYEWE